MEGHVLLLCAVLRRAYLDDDVSFLSCKEVVSLAKELGITEENWEEMVMPSGGWIELYYVIVRPDEPVSIGVVNAIDRERNYRLEKAIPETNGRVVIQKSGHFNPFALTRLGAIEKARGKLKEHIKNDRITIAGLEAEIAACNTYLLQLDCLQNA